MVCCSVPPLSYREGVPISISVYVQVEGILFLIFCSLHLNESFKRRQSKSEEWTGYALRLIGDMDPIAY